jgi:acetyltransferase-like isoleucine patch superfamily enzyme
MLQWILSPRRKLLMVWRRIRFGLRHVHHTAYIGESTYVLPDLRMAEYSFINRGCWIDSNVVIGRYSMLGPFVAIVGGDHYFDQPGTPIPFSGRPDQPRTTIEDDVWIGCGTIIMAGITVGRGAIIAAGTVVTKDVAPYEIHTGVPNRKLRDRFAGEDRAKHDQMLDGPILDGRHCPTKARFN